MNVNELAEALYEGSPKLSNLAETLAREHGQAQALSFYGSMGADVQNSWRSIAAQIIEHSRHWMPNDGCACVLDEKESARLKVLPGVWRELW